MTLEVASQEQNEDLLRLINTAYRGTEGWTRETDIVAGARIKIQDIDSMISNPDAHLLVYSQDERIIACICIEKNNDKAYIGTFAVDPAYQAKGLGKKVLSMAEAYAREELNVSQFIMVVVSQRHELISYYERRGYRRSGQVDAYPVHLDVGEPMIDGLTIEYLVKSA